MPDHELEGGLALAGTPRRGLEGHLLLHGFKLIWMITLIQVTALVISAVRQSTSVLEEMDHEDAENDLLRSPSDSAQPFAEARSSRDDGRWPM